MANLSTVQVLLLDQDTYEFEDNVWTKQYMQQGIKITRFDNVNLFEDVAIFGRKCDFSIDCIVQLRQVAYRHINIGTVSPLLKAELCNFLSDAKEKELISTDQVDDVLKACATEEMPNALYNLFDCIYIRHELIQDIGIPTKEMLCDQRLAMKWFEMSRQLGWKNKVCTSMLMPKRIDSAINKGTRFYSQEKHLWESLLHNIRFYNDLHLGNGRKCILHYLLADFQEGASNNIGGTQFHVADLAEYQKDIYNVFILARDGEYLRLTEYVNDEKIPFDFWVGEIPEHLCFYDKRFEDICELIIENLGIDLVHIHHVMWMTLDIFYVAQKHEIPVVLSVHDFYFMCPVLKMIDPQGIPCNKESCLYNCNTCLLKNKQVLDGKRYLAKCHKEYKKAIELCSRIIFPSKEASDVMHQYYPEIAQKVSIIGHGIKLPQFRMEQTFSHTRKRIAFIGGISDIKGGAVIYDLITRNPEQYEWYIMGGISYVKLYHLKQKNLHKTGWYKRYEIYNLLEENEIDIVFILSTVEETFCYTLSEATALGIPVLATAVGALGRRLNEFDSGWLVPRDATAPDIEQCLQEICKSEELYQKKKEKTLAIKQKDLNQMGNEYDLLYSEYLCDSMKHIPVNIGKIGSFRRQECINENAEVEQEQISSLLDNDSYRDGLKEEVMSLRNRLIELENSPIIRCAMKIRKISFPGKNALKRLYVRVRK